MQHSLIITCGLLTNFTKTLNIFEAKMKNMSRSIEVLTKLMELGEVFTTDEAKRRLGLKESALYYHLRRLVELGFLERTWRGRYLIKPNPNVSISPDAFLLASLLVKPSAIS